MWTVRPCGVALWASTWFPLLETVLLVFVRGDEIVLHAMPAGTELDLLAQDRSRAVACRYGGGVPVEVVPVVVVLRVVVGVLLLAHGLVHLLYLAPDVSQFSLERSWLVPEAARRPAAYVLTGTIIVAFVLVALCVWGVPGLGAAWPVLTLVAAALSTLLLVLFWNRQLVFGVVVNAVLVAGVLMRPGWLERFMGGG